mmetsp:Transcript_10106/g.17065  ORF Transcript_10106/g.17065 Transcript_10106/m.17065 type:complete len:183 (-) Transcript_10106:1018-1566(-)
MDQGIWVSYEDGVFDVTEFVRLHPGGGDKLMMVAGGAVEPFWEMYPFHKKGDIKKLLSQYRIGTLHEADRLKKENLNDFSEIQKEEVLRSGNLIKHQEFPFCAETSKQYLTDHFLTPSTEMYVRNHNKVPEFDEDFESEFELELDFKLTSSNQKFKDLFGERELKPLTLDQLKKMPQHSVVT